MDGDTPRRTWRRRDMRNEFFDEHSDADDDHDAEDEDEYFRQTVEASRLQQPPPSRRRSPNDEDDDSDLQEAIRASQEAYLGREGERSRQEEERRAREAADEAAAIAESTRMAARRADAERMQAADSDADLERVLRESAAEAEAHEAARKRELARLHASFGSGGADSIGRGETYRDHASSAAAPLSPSPSLRSNRSSRGSRQRERSSSTPRPSFTPTSEQRLRSQTSAQDSVITSRPRSRQDLEPISTSDTRSSSRNSIPERQRPRSPGGNLLQQAFENARRPSGRSSSISHSHPISSISNSPIRPDFPDVDYDSFPPHASNRHHQPFPTTQHPHFSRRPSPPNDLDASMRLALNSSRRTAHLEAHHGGPHHSHEMEIIRRVVIDSLGDAPPPPDPSEGLLDPPPRYDDIKRDKVIDPLRYTTTNVRGNEPGYIKHMTPRILDRMLKSMIKMQKFEDELKADGKDHRPSPPNHPSAKKRSTSSSSTPATSRAEPAENLDNLLGGSRPGPSQLPRTQPDAPGDEFVSRVSGLATNARTRLPNARPWDRAFSRIRAVVEGREGG